jgi:hypothetical protein
MEWVMVYAEMSKFKWHQNSGTVGGVDKLE